MKTTYIVQGGGRDEFPFFGDQNGNGVGDPPPFGEPTANLDSPAFVFAMIGIAVILIMYIKGKKQGKL